MSHINLFSGLTAAPDERFDTLFSGSAVRIERIVSWGQSSPPGFWCDQDEDEWVAVLSGKARLSLLDPDEEVLLAPGDWLWIAARRKHRIEWTLPDAATLWLAVFVREQDAEVAKTEVES